MVAATAAAATTAAKPSLCECNTDVFQHSSFLSIVQYRDIASCIGIHACELHTVYRFNQYVYATMERFFCLRSHQYTHHRHTGVNGNLLATVNEPYLFSSTFYGFDSSAKINCTEYFVHHDATQIGIISKIIFHRQLNRLNDICACTHNGTKECVASTFTNDVRL